MNLIGKIFSVRNHMDRSGIHSLCEGDTGEIPGAPRFINGKVVQYTPGRHGWSGWVRMEFTGPYIPGPPRYSNISVKFLRSPEPIINSPEKPDSSEKA